MEKKFSENNKGNNEKTKEIKTDNKGSEKLNSKKLRDLDNILMKK